MKTKNLAIYNPKGAAAEYAKWACNLYVGCPHQCDYCYCRSGFMGSTLGGPVPEVKKILGGDEDKAFQIFCKELDKYADQIRTQGGLFFSFSTDPMVFAELPLTYRCIERCFMLSVPVVILTKATQWWYQSATLRELFCHYRHLLAIGFTLTGHDEMETCAATNMRRISLMAKLKEQWFKTWASIEPIIDPLASLSMIREAEPFCDHFKVGLRSGVKKSYYKDEDLAAMFVSMERNNYRDTYLKDSFVKRLGIARDSLASPFVDKDYKLV